MNVWSSNWRFLLRQLVARDIEAKHKGTAGGVFWLIAQPLLMLAIYTLVFGLIFQPRWKGVESIWDYALILFLGKIPYIYILESIGRSPSIIVSHSAYAKRTQFPLELLVYMAQMSAIVGAAISMTVWLAFYMLIHQDLPGVRSLLVPLIYLPMCLSSAGISLLLASLGTYFRDVGQVVQPILFSMMFLSPVFYPIAQSPALMRPWLELNPMSQVIEQSRSLLYFEMQVDWQWWSGQMILGIALVGLGSLWFRRTKGGFAEVL